MADKEFNQKFEKFLNDKKFSKAEIVGMYVLCNEREHDLKQELSNYRAALASRENELRYKETVIKELDKEIETLKADKELQEQEIRRLNEILENKGAWYQENRALKAENERLRKMGESIKAVILEAPPELITDTIWVDGDPIVDYIDVMMDWNEPEATI